MAYGRSALSREVGLREGVPGKVARGGYTWSSELHTISRQSSRYHVVELACPEEERGDNGPAKSKEELGSTPSKQASKQSRRREVGLRECAAYECAGGYQVYLPREV